MMSTGKSCLRTLLAILATVLLLPVQASAQEPQPENTRSDHTSKQRFLHMFRHSSERTASDAGESDSSRRRSRRESYSEYTGAEGLTDAATDSISYDGAHLRFDQTVWDFGSVSRKGGDVVKEFTFVNDGSKPLVITGITMSCTCIKVEYPKRPVGVGERSSIRLVYEPHKMSPGVFYKVVQVHSNSVDGVRHLTVSGSAFDGRKKR